MNYENNTEKGLAVYLHRIFYKKTNKNDSLCDLEAQLMKACSTLILSLITTNTWAKIIKFALTYKIFFYVFIFSWLSQLNK